MLAFCQRQMHPAIVLQGVWQKPAGSTEFQHDYFPPIQKSGIMPA